jgi:hypothetical protein
MLHKIFSHSIKKQKKIKTMKKQILFTAVLISGILFSCSKEKIGTPAEENTASVVNTSSAASAKVNSLSVGLEGWFRFDASIQDATGKLLGAYSMPIAGAAVYTTDRNGMPNMAIQFNGRYNLAIPAVPHSTNMSVAAWIKYDDANAPGSSFINSQSDGPMIEQVADQFYAYHNPAGSPFFASGPLNDKWHFYVVTIDGTNLCFYIDGNLVGTVASPDVYNDTSEFYHLGYGNIVGSWWHGAIDDLRFYSRTLNSKEVTALYHL